MRTTGRVESPRQVAERIKGELAGNRQKLFRAMGWRSLKIDAPPGCDDKLAKEFEKHNKAADKLTDDQSALDAAAGALAMAMSDPEVSGVQIAERAAGIRQLRYDLLQRLQVCLGSQHALLTACLESAGAAVEKAEDNVGKVKAATAKKLKAAGYCKENLPQWPNNPTAAETAFDYRLREMKPVQDALEALANANALHAAIQDKRAMTSTHGDLIYAELARAWRAIVGEFLPQTPLRDTTPRQEFREGGG